MSNPWLARSRVSRKFYKAQNPSASQNRKETIMSSVAVMNEVVPAVVPVDMKLEVVLLSVSDVDRAKAFYEKLGWRLDVDVANGGFRGVQMTPYNSNTSIIFGNGGISESLVLAVADIDAARRDLIARGVNVSDVFHFAAGPYNDTVENPRIVGRDPEGRSYFSFVSFDDPDGNNWLLQEVTMRAPGREWTSSPQATDIPMLAELLHETAEHHGPFENSHVPHQWWDWYAAYLSARKHGSTPEEASALARRYMEDDLHVLPL
jgi:catechol 2,3-dioxygenase-like lactoylglutathione lyase family enzyme